MIPRLMTLTAVRTVGSSARPSEYRSNIVCPLSEVMWYTDVSAVGSSHVFSRQ
jgi:hypothetical protein